MRTDHFAFVSTRVFAQRAAVVAACLAALLMAGCQRTIRNTPVTPRPTPWFCEINESRDDWDCVQDRALAENPRPKRLPNDPVEEAAPIETKSAIAVTPGAGELNRDAPAGGIANPSAAIDLALMQAVEARDESASARVLEMAEDGYAVQLVAVASSRLAKRFTEEHALEDVLTLQLAREEDFYYVVLLGTYDTFAQAQAAVEARPDSLADITPWIRPLASIQSAIRQAEALLEAGNS